MTLIYMNVKYNARTHTYSVYIHIGLTVYYIVSLSLSLFFSLSFSHPPCVLVMFKALPSCSLVVGANFSLPTTSGSERGWKKTLCARETNAKRKRKMKGRQQREDHFWPRTRSIVPRLYIQTAVYNPTPLQCAQLQPLATTTTTLACFYSPFELSFR